MSDQSIPQPNSISTIVFSEMSHTFLMEPEESTVSGFLEYELLSVSLQ